MKVLAINGSPRGREGNTERILQPFLEGTRDAGAKIETIYLKDKKINHCIGCFSCWTKTPGVCVHHDDMPELLEKALSADMLVYATPLYCFTVTGLMKDFMDRNIPLVTPAIQEQEGLYLHDPRRERKARKRVLISNCGFPGPYNFSGLLETFKLMTRGELNAAILTTQGGILQEQEILEEMLTPFFAAVRQSGKEVVELGKITAETQKIIDQDF
ncbi:MAG TPA: flavodoxin family protein, partial [Firmicutes bacterium]|nr:flavodoxin family protein [Bacillota bacterium]